MAAPMMVTLVLPRPCRSLSVYAGRPSKPPPVPPNYGPLKRSADEPPSRAITVLDLAHGSCCGTVIGTWMQHENEIPSCKSSPARVWVMS